MRYSSTRGRDNKRKFEQIVYAGLASDGGLYEPLSWPSHRKLQKLLSADAALSDVVGEVLRLFATPDFSDLDFTDIAREAFSGFSNATTAPLREVERDLWLLELFHGPTLSFKDLPLQVYGRLLESIATRRKRLLIMVGATSGDTGSAAIAALRPIRGLRLFMLHPRGRISELQRRQMTCNQVPHIRNIAVEGSYDDCLRLAKAMFSSEEIKARGELGAVNSFNWVRIAVQAAIYIYAANRLPEKYKKVRFALPSGNFGNAYAGYVAKQLGAPIERIELAVSKNDCLHNFFETGRVKIAEVVPSLTPSIDIMTPNNLERFIYRLLGGSARRWRKLLAKSEGGKGISIPKSFMRKDAFKFFRSFRFDDEQTLEAMVQAYQSLGSPLDPHSSIALAAARQARLLDAKMKRSDTIATIAFATASAAKFPDTVERAIGAMPHIPLKLSELKDKQELYENIPAEEAVLEELIIKRLRMPLDSDIHFASGKDDMASGSYVVSATSAKQETSDKEVAAAVASEAMVADEEFQQETAQETAVQETAVQETAQEISPNELSMAVEPTTSSYEYPLATATSTTSAPTPSTPTTSAPIGAGGAEGAEGASPIADFAAITDAMLPPKTASEESLEQKISKLKEQTAQLEETLDTSAISHTSRSAFAMPPVAMATTTDSTIFEPPAGVETSVPAGALPENTLAYRGQESLQGSPQNNPLQDSPPMQGSPPMQDNPLDDSQNNPLGDSQNNPLGEPAPSASASDSMSLGQYVAASVPAADSDAEGDAEGDAKGDAEGDAKGDDGFENLAQAAEEGQASLESKIAKLKEQSALLDDAAEQTKRSLDTSAAKPSFASSSTTTDVADVAHTTDVVPAPTFAREEPAEKPGEGSIAGASPFFRNVRASPTPADAQTVAEQSRTSAEQKDQPEETQESKRDDKF